MAWTLNIWCNVGNPIGLPMMPRYFFHLHTEAGVEWDPAGLEFPSLDTALADAKQARHEYLRDEGIKSARERRQCRYEITDQSGNVVATVPAADL